MTQNTILNISKTIVLVLMGWCCLSCGGNSTQDKSRPVPTVDCDLSGECPQLWIPNDPPSVGPGTFHGYADSSLLHDPEVEDRLWLAYSWLDIITGSDVNGDPVDLAVVSSHLARSDDGGQTFSFVEELYPAIPLSDPEGSGEDGILSSETVSLATMDIGGNRVWYGAHLRYFLRPITGYNPNYNTSWTIRIGAAPSPDGLGNSDVIANETTLGVSTTADAYSPDVALDQLAGLPIWNCAMVNNPALFAQNGSLYLIVECLAFVGTDANYNNTTLQVFGTTPTGDPQNWVWRHVGKLSDHSLAQEMGADTILQPEVTLAADGSLILLVTPAVIDNSLQVGTRGNGCVAIALESIDPPVIRRNSEGQAVVRADILGEGFCACTFDSDSATGILSHVQWQGHLYSIHATGVTP